MAITRSTTERSKAKPSQTSVTGTQDKSLRTRSSVASRTSSARSTNSLPPARGYSKAYKAKANSSRRTRLLRDLFIDTVAQEEKTSTGKAGSRLRKKGKKIDSSLHEIEPNAEKGFLASSLEDTKHMFSSNKQSTRCKNYIHELDVVDTTDGAFMLDTAGDIVFMLLPRQEVLEVTGKKTHGDIEALKRLHNTTGSIVRGHKREGISEGNYSTVGVRADRAGHGIAESKFAQTSPADWNVFVKLVRRCEGMAARYLPSSVLRGLQKVMAVSKCPTMTKQSQSGGKKNSPPTSPPTSPPVVPLPSPLSSPPTSPPTSGPPPPKVTSIFAAIANAMNYVSGAHQDIDFFLSFLTVNVCGLTTKENPKYRLDSPVAHYFIFPEQGVAVALRPGDMLLFNPQYFHCLAEKEKSYQERSVFVTSFYLKTAVIGKNDNRIPLTELEKALEKASKQA
jgi:hypothetical protein